MQHLLNLPGFEGQRIALEEAGWVSGARLLQNGQPAAKGAKRGEYRLRRDDGRDVAVKMKAALFDPVPALEVEGAIYRVAPPLQWFEWAWSGAPLALLFLGGALGGFLGGLAMAMNIRIFRMQLSPALKYLLSAAVSGVALVCFLILAVILALLMKK